MCRVVVVLALSVAGVFFGPVGCSGGGGGKKESVLLDDSPRVEVGGQSHSKSPSVIGSKPGAAIASAPVGARPGSSAAPTLVMTSGTADGAVEPGMAKATAQAQAMFDAIKARGGDERGVGDVPGGVGARGPARPGVYEAPPADVDAPATAVGVPVLSAATEASAVGAKGLDSERAAGVRGVVAEPAAQPGVAAAPVTTPVTSEAIAMPTTPAATTSAPTPPAAQAPGGGAQTSSLRISALVVCTKIEGFGRLTPMDVSRLPAGRGVPMLLYTEVDGFAHRSGAGLPPPMRVGSGGGSEGDDGSTEWVVHLSQEVTIRRDDSSGALVRLYESRQSRDVARRLRRDHYLVQRIKLPEGLTPGPYVLTATVKDLASGEEAQSQVRLTVVGR